MKKDEIERRPASENPWYVLMTIGGNQDKDFDPGLQDINKRFWHGWIAENLPKERISELVAVGTLQQEDVEPFTSEEKKALDEEMYSRAGGKFPDPAKTIELNRCSFDLDANFCGFYFPSAIDFSQSDFCQSSNFDKANFSNFVSFDDAVFFENASFTKTRFDTSFTFSTPTFRKQADFQGAEFEKNIQFYKGNFLGCTIFDNVEVKNDVTFFGSRFFEKFSIKGVDFPKICKFNKTRFGESCEFVGSTFHGITDFSGAIFAKQCDFSDCSFKRKTLFGTVVFQKCVPKFYGAKLHEDTNWSDVTWPVPLNVADVPADMTRCYERLKLIMDGQKKTHDEQMFHRMELRCRELEEGFPRNLPSRAYGMVSGYGWSLVRPGIALALLVMIGWMVLGPVLCWGGGSASEVGACSFRGLYVSVSNTFGFLGLWRLIPEPVELIMEQSVLAMIVKIFQAVLGPVLLFFLLLALRNRYRMR